MNDYPKTGVGVMIFKDGKVLVGKRKLSHGAGTYQFPGGHLEYMESFVECAERETREECGIEITNVRFQAVANFRSCTPKHYTHICLIADWLSGEPKVLEPESSEEWQWYLPEEIPIPLATPSQVSLDSYKTNQNFFDNV